MFPQRLREIDDFSHPLTAGRFRTHCQHRFIHKLDVWEIGFTHFASATGCDSPFPPGNSFSKRLTPFFHRFRLKRYINAIEQNIDLTIDLHHSSHFQIRVFGNQPLQIGIQQRIRRGASCKHGQVSPPVPKIRSLLAKLIQKRLPIQPKDENDIAIKNPFSPQIQLLHFLLQSVSGQVLQPKCHHHPAPGCLLSIETMQEIEQRIVTVVEIVEHKRLIQLAQLCFKLFHHRMIRGAIGCDRKYTETAIAQLHGID